ncbi:MAG: hypothetical protein C3F13_01765 [Anaerolineales bacterium]|nr:hypothetical protein [Anaerolineae bacterium]PWB56290.1 MAG: hypothetical protein C3F13_01765 [Anaerolineales bacterium]
MTEATTVRKTNGSRRIRIGLGVTIFGFIVYLLGAEPGLYGLDRSPVVGFVQIATFLVGLGFICLGGYISLVALWNGGQKSIASDIGLRLVGTGYVIAVASGMADIFGFGSNNYPTIPVFGIYQQVGVIIGEIVIAVGLLLLIPYKHPEPGTGEINLA